jgi:nitrite reductase/ring-hydroxylating ferredoxin subunit/putative sterol carrier protein
MERGLPPIPYGWFVVRFSSELVPGQVERLQYFGRELVLFRTEAGRAVIFDAHCPHLGAHLAFGGEVVGESLRCPFHHWRFDEQGTCVEVPACDKIPPKAKAQPWPVLEQNGMIRTWFHPEGVAPMFEIPAVDDDGWTPLRTTHWRIKSHAQEVNENTVDIAHMQPVHHTGQSTVIRGPDVEGPLMKLALNFIASAEIIGMEGDNDVVLDITMYGLGGILVHAHIRNVDMHARYRVCCTPVDEETTEIFGTVSLQHTGDDEFTREAADLFYEAYTKDFVKDFPIWENKIYRPQPYLSAADGPIGLYRRWAKQFYVAPSRARPQPERHDTAGSAAMRMPLPVQLAREALHSVSRLLSRVRESLPGPLGTPTTRTAPAATTSYRDETPRASATTTPPASVGAPTGPPVPRIETVEDYFATLHERFQPQASKGVNAVFQWEIGGEGGGTKHAIVEDGSMKLFDGPHGAPTVTIAMNAGEYVDVVNGDANGPRAFTVGSGKVSGKLRMAMKMQRIFPSASA